MDYTLNKRLREEFAKWEAGDESQITLDLTHPPSSMQISIDGTASTQIDAVIKDAYRWVLESEEFRQLFYGNVLQILAEDKHATLKFMRDTIAAEDAPDA